MISGFIFCALVIRLGIIQIAESNKYMKLALEQQTRDIPIPAKRGIIYDRNKKELAVSASTSTIWARPAEIKQSAKMEEIAQTLSQILGEDKQKLISILGTKRSLVKVAKNVEKEKADKIREADLPGISIAEDVKRYYPLGSFASQILGNTTNDNRGLSGVELKYNKYLSGTPGRWAKNTDAFGRQLSKGTEKYYKAENGLNIVLTVDEVIQHFIEKTIEKAYAETQAQKVMCIAMDPKTGGILGMAVYPDYDPNNSRVPLLPKDQEYFDSLTNKQKEDFWSEMWRNPLISDTYEPGSTFKLITTSIALQEGVTSLDDKFNCAGTIVVADKRLKCWRYPRTHGHQNLIQGVQNSCNPVFVTLGQRVGVDKYFQYLEAFGFTDKTGIDFPGESTPIIQPKQSVGPVELATMSYGQGISVTPIQLVTAISAIGNDGKLMKPRIVKELVDDNGNIIHNYQPETVKQAISKKTSEDMRTIMEAVVSSGTGKNAMIPGYRIGGKTGTADKVIDGKYQTGKVYSSFIAMAPINDPKITLLFIVDEPQGVHFGSITAAPYVKQILLDTLTYLNIKPNFTQEELEKMKDEFVVMPQLKGLKFSEAKSILEKSQLSYEVTPPDSGGLDFIVQDQYPKNGEKIKKGLTVFIYK